MVSFTSLFVASVLALVAYRQQPYRWLASHVTFLTAQATFDLLFTFTIIRHLYLATGTAASGSAGSTAYLVLNAVAEIAILYAAPRFVLEATGRPSMRVARLLLLPAVTSAVLTISISWVEDPAGWSRTLVALTYTYLSCWFALGILRHRSLPGAPWGLWIRVFLVGAFAWHVVTAVDALFLRIPLPTTPRVSFAAFSSSVFNVFWASVVIVPSVRQLRSTGLVGPQATGPLPESFIREYGLTQRECDIVIRICRGAATRAIAEELFISPRTVDTHIQNIHRKCDVSRRVELIALVQRYA